MCGIVGYIGKRNAVEVILEGLKRLEYRGYDSAGICFKNDHGAFVIEKQVGKIEKLIDQLQATHPKSHIGLGHTRWATHGGVNLDNAHPHYEKNIAIVHNGIVENYQELKAMLVQGGEHFKSETDSEVFAKLVEKYYAKTGELKDAVLTAFKMVKGGSAFVVIDQKKDEIVAIKRGAPLVCGTSKDNSDLLVSSDPYALIGFSDLLYFPEDEILCGLNIKGSEKIEFFDLEGRPTQKFYLQQQTTHLEASDKGPFEHYMMKEIHEQPALIRNLVQTYIDGTGRNEVLALKNLNFKRIVIVACGTAWHAGLVLRSYLEGQCKIPTQVEFASEFRYKDPLLFKDDLCMFISQSGETADTLGALELCRERRLSSLGVVNVKGSTLYRNVQYPLLIQAGQEIGVASTKAFTLQVLTGLLFAYALQGTLASPETKREILLLADRMEEFLENSQIINQIAQEIYNKKGFFFTGRGKYFPIALEGALKLKEIAYVHAEGYASGELKHGPIALIDEEMVNVAILGPELYTKALSNVEEIKARRGIIVGIGPKDQDGLKKISDHYIGLNFDGLDSTAPLYVNVVTQLLSYAVAKLKGTDIDRPRNLAKSVTVE